jgi:hypothetical protein
VELSRIADRHYLAAGLPRRLEQDRSLSGWCHPGLVKNHNAPGRHRLSALERQEHRVERLRAADPGLFDELAYRTAGRGDANDLIAGLLVDVAQSAGGVGLPGAGESFDYLHSVPGGDGRLDRLALARVQRLRALLDRPLGELPIDSSDAFGSSALGGGNQPALDRDQVGGRHLAALGTKNVQAVREPATAVDQDPDARSLLSLLGQRPQNRSLIERVLQFGQAKRASQAISDRTFRLRSRGRPAPRATIKRLQSDPLNRVALVAVKTVLGGAGLYLFSP